MKTEFVMAVNQLAAEKHLPKEAVLQAVEQALASAFRKDELAGYNLWVKIHPTTGEVQVYARQVVVEAPVDPHKEVSLAEAQKVRAGAQVGETIDIEVTPKYAGRIAAQTARQVVQQRLRQAEYSAIFEEFRGREGEILTGVVQRVDPKQVSIALGRGEGVLPLTEQVKGERYRSGQTLRTYLVEAQRSPRGPVMIVSRTHKNLLRCLLELEVPEIGRRAIEIKAIAREPGSRSKVAVVALQEGVDPVGSCVGLRGLRIQSIVKELGGEKIDVVQWSADPAAFVASALSPAQVLKVEVRPEEKAATVIVPDRQLSLAIGKEGQNARLAAKLTGWRIDIKSASAAEAEKVKEVPPEAVAPAKAVAAAPVAVEEPIPSLEEAPLAVPVEAAPVLVEAGATAAPVAEISFPVPATAEKGPLRFAEDVFPHRATVEKKKKKEKEEGVKPKKPRRARKEPGLAEYEEVLE